MKTPREILTERHQSAAPKLDAIRQECAGQASRLSQNKQSETGRMPVLQLIWHELIFPSRRIWAGLAAIWLLILAANFSMRDHSPAAMAMSPSPEMTLSYQKQVELLTQLTSPNGPALAEPQKTYKPGPSTQRFSETLAA